MPDGFIPSLSALVDSGKRTLKQKLADLLSNPLPYLQQTAGQVNEDAKSFNRTSLAAALGDPMAKHKLKASMLDTAMNFAPALTVWHGSPHKFNKFDMSKIGTGEGAQAYGHGLYMAESPEVAKTYANAGINSPEITYQGKTYKASSPEGQLLRDVTQLGRRGAYEKYPDKTDLIKTVNPDDVKFSGGSIYKSDIPDEAVARFLDWDKPLSQQAPEVQRALGRAGVDTANHFGTGGGLISELKGMGGIADMPWMGQGEQFLSKAGIPGIRYLDGGSRSAGQGSSNFVLFDDQLPRILEINGAPTGLQPWKPGEWK